MWKFTSYIMYKEHHRVRVKFQRESRGAQESYTSSSYHVRVTTVRSQLVCSLSHLSDPLGGGVPVWPMSPFTTSCQVDFDEELFYMDNCGYLTVLYICNAFNICIKYLYNDKYIHISFRQNAGKLIFRSYASAGRYVKRYLIVPINFIISINL